MKPATWIVLLAATLAWHPRAHAEIFIDLQINSLVDHATGEQFYTWDLLAGAEGADLKSPQFVRAQGPNGQVTGMSRLDSFPRNFEYYGLFRPLRPLTNRAISGAALNLEQLKEDLTGDWAVTFDTGLSTQTRVTFTVGSFADADLPAQGIGFDLPAPGSSVPQPFIVNLDEIQTIHGKRPDIVRVETVVKRGTTLFGSGDTIVLPEDATTLDLTDAIDVAKELEFFTLTLSPLYAGLDFIDPSSAVVTGDAGNTFGTDVTLRSGYRNQITGLGPFQQVPEPTSASGLLLLCAVLRRRQRHTHASDQRVFLG